MKRISAFGWSEFVIGLVLIALGIFVMVMSPAALTGFLIACGITAIILGIQDIVLYARAQRFTGFGPMLALASGIMSVMSGVLILIYPSAGRMIFNLLFPLWFIAHCVSRLSRLDAVRLISGKAVAYIMLALNLVGLTLGVAMFFSPSFTLFAASIIAGCYLILQGIESLIMAFSRMGGKR